MSPPPLGADARQSWTRGHGATAVERGHAPGVVAAVARGEMIEVASAGVMEIGGGSPLTMVGPLMATAKLRQQHAGAACPRHHVGCDALLHAMSDIATLLERSKGMTSLLGGE